MCVLAKRRQQIAMTVAEVAEQLKEQGRSVAAPDSSDVATEDLIARVPTELRTRTTPAKPQAVPPAHSSNGRQRRVEHATNRVRRDGKFFRLGDDKFFVKGVTYGPFALNADGDPYPSLKQTRA